MSLSVDAGGAGNDDEGTRARRMVRVYWATAGATVVGVTAAVVAIMVALNTGGSTDDPDQAGGTSAPSEAASTAPERPGGGLGAAPVGESPTPAPGADDEPAEGSEYRQLFEAEELVIPEQDCPRPIEIDFDTPTFDTEEPLDGSDAEVCNTGNGAWFVNFTPYQGKGVTVSEVAAGASLEQCLDALEFPDNPISYSQFCMETGEGNIFYISTGSNGTYYRITAWEPVG